MVLKSVSLQYRATRFVVNLRRMDGDGHGSTEGFGIIGQAHVTLHSHRRLQKKLLDRGCEGQEDLI